MIGQLLTGGGLIFAGKLIEDHEAFARLARQYRPLIEASAKHYSVSPFILAAVLFKESSFDPSKRGAAGEIGIGQMMPIGLADLQQNGYSAFQKLTTNDLFKPENAIPATAAYLQLNRKRTGSIFRSVRAYNVGPDLKDKSGDNGMAYMADIVKNALADFLYTTFDNGVTA